MMRTGKTEGPGRRSRGGCKRRAAQITTLLLATLLIVGCEGKEPNPKTTPPAQTAGASLAWLLSEAPRNPVTVLQAKANAKADQEIAIRGRIGGRKDALSAESPVFVIVEETDLKPCDPEYCKTPWDFCCNMEEDKAERMATIHLIGDGSAGQLDPTAGGKIAPYDEVIVVGKVGPRDNPSVLTLKATGVYRIGQ